MTAIELAPIGDRPEARREAEIGRRLPLPVGLTITSLPATPARVKAALALAEARRREVEAEPPGPAR